MRMLKFRTVDNQTKTMMVDESKTVYHLMDAVCQRIGIQNNHEYSLATKDALATEAEIEIREAKKREMEKIAAESNIDTGFMIYRIIEYNLYI